MKGTLTVRRALARSWITTDGKRELGWSLQEPKTARSRRTIHMPKVAVEALDRQLAGQEADRLAAGTAWQDRAGLVFTDVIGRPMVASDVTRTFSEMLKVAKLPHVPFHALRHSAATAWLAGGVPLRTVADQLGHSTITITADLYAAGGARAAPGCRRRHGPGAGMSEQELRLRIAERLREQLATWSREHPHEPLNVAIRQAAARAMKDGQATPEVPTPQTMRDAKDTWSASTWNGR